MTQPDADFEQRVVVTPPDASSWQRRHTPFTGAEGRCRVASPERPGRRSRPGPGLLGSWR